MSANITATKLAPNGIKTNGSERPDLRRHPRLLRTHQTVRPVVEDILVFAGLIVLMIACVYVVGGIK
jgi:hypothetical protein